MLALFEYLRIFIKFFKKWRHQYGLSSQSKNAGGGRMRGRGSLLGQSCLGKYTSHSNMAEGLFKNTSNFNSLGLEMGYQSNLLAKEALDNMPSWGWWILSRID